MFVDDFEIVFDVCCVDGFCFFEYYVFEEMCYVGDFGVFVGGVDFCDLSC